MPIKLEANLNDVFKVLAEDSADPAYDGWVLINVYRVSDNSLVGTPIVLKKAGDKIAANFPGLDPNLFVLDENGKITNG